MSDNYKSLLNELDLSTEYLSVDNLVVNNLEPNALSYVNQGRELRSLPLGLGQIAIGSLGGPPHAGYIQGTANQVNVVNGANVSLSLPQDIDTKSSPSFNVLGINGINFPAAALRKKIDLFSGTSSSNFFYGMAHDMNETVIQCPGSAKISFKTGAFYEGPTGPAETSATLLEVHSSGEIVRSGYDAKTSLGDPNFRYKDLFLSGDIITDGKVDGRDIAADGLALDNLATSMANYVTTNTAQTITGAKTINDLSSLQLKFPPGTGTRKKIDLYGGSSGSDHVFYGMALEANTTVIQCPSHAQNIKFMVGNVTESLEILEIRGDRTRIRPGEHSLNLSLGMDTRPFNELYLKGTATIGGKVNGRDIAADGKVLDDLAVSLGNYVTIAGTQTITGSKTFGNNFNQQKSTSPTFRLQSSTGTGNATLELQGRSDFAPCKISSSGMTGALEMYSPREYYISNPLGAIMQIIHNIPAILPGIPSGITLGVAETPFKAMYLGLGDGVARLGHSFRTTNRAELHLHSNGDVGTDIMFGVDDRTDANVNWSMGARPGASSDFKFYRGNRNAGGAFSEFLSFKGDGKAITPNPTNPTNIGEEKNKFGDVWAAKLNFSELVFPFTPGIGVVNMPLKIHGYFPLALNYNGTYGSNWWQSGVQKKIEAVIGKTGDTVTITFPAVSGVSSSTFTGSNWFNFSSTLPTVLSPGSNQSQVIAIEGNGNWSAGNISITTAGKVDIYNGYAAGGWSGGQSCGFKGFSISYIINVVIPV